MSLLSQVDQSPLGPRTIILNALDGHVLKNRGHQLDEAYEAPLPGRSACVTCGAVRYGPFCSECGQREIIGRYTLRMVATSALRRTVGEEGALTTIKQLVVRPGWVIRDFLSGRSVRYVHPATYLLLTAAIFAVVSSTLGNATGGGESDQLFALLIIPFVAAAARVIFWRGSYNYAEHLIAVVYLAAQAILFLAVLYVGVLIVPQALIRWFAVVPLAVCVGYFVWGYSQMFEQRRLLVAGRALAALLIGTVAWLAFTLVMVTLLRR
jgi:hypothetical protein